MPSMPRRGHVAPGVIIGAGLIRLLVNVFGSRQISGMTLQKVWACSIAPCHALRQT